MFFQLESSLTTILLWNLPVIVCCLWVAFRVRGQDGAMHIMTGAALLLCIELALVLTQFQSVGFMILADVPRIGILLLFGVTLFAFGLIGVGIMRPHQKKMILETRPGRWLNVALFSAIFIDVCLLADRVAGPSGTGLIASWQDFFHVLSLALLVVVVTVRHIHHTTLSRQAAAGERQLDAMLSMFSAVKHDLNNDMQVVVGNAELAGILIENGGNVTEPVNKITDAATAAIDRIEQLSVFSAASDSSTSAIDLNAALRENITRLSAEVPSIVTLRLELEHLPIRVMADRYLLGLSLTHLIRQAVKTMEHGGEIVVSTRDMSHRNRKPGMAVVNAEVFIVRALSQAANVTGSQDEKALAGNNHLLKVGLATTKALVERSGAISVSHSIAPNESSINMGFITEAPRESSQGALMIKESYG